MLQVCAVAIIAKIMALAAVVPNQPGFGCDIDSTHNKDHALDDTACQSSDVCSLSLKPVTVLLPLLER